MRRSPRLACQDRRVRSIPYSVFNILRVYAWKGGHATNARRSMTQFVGDGDHTRRHAKKWARVMLDYSTLCWPNNSKSLHVRCIFDKQFPRRRSSFLHEGFVSQVYNCYELISHHNLSTCLKMTSRRRPSLRV